MPTSIATKYQYILIQKVPHLPEKKKQLSDMSSEDSFTSKHTGHSMAGSFRWGFSESWVAGAVAAIAAAFETSHATKIPVRPKRGFNCYENLVETER